MRKSGVIFEEMTLRYFPGRARAKTTPQRRKLISTATAVVEIVIQEISAKMREGGPKGPQDAVEDAPGTRGVVSCEPEHCRLDLGSLRVAFEKSGPPRRLKRLLKKSWRSKFG